MNNLEWIATYIFNNPGVRHREVTREMQKWRGQPSYCRGWGSRYFSRRQWPGAHYGHQRPYLTTLWRKLDENDKHSGYIVTQSGLQYVRKTITPFNGGKKS